jgi:hypothetical protein
MRIPLYRGAGDERPTAWWEWPFFPLACVVLVVYGVLIVTLLGVLAVLSIPYFALYPDRHASDYDFGTARQQELMRRYRRFTARVSLRRRCLRVLTFYCRANRHQLPRRAIRAFREERFPQ